MDIAIQENKNNIGFFHKWYIYQKERFPFVAHGILIFAFSFSAVSYALLCNGEQSFISLKVFLPGFVIAFSLFLLLRILDEFKDQHDDKLYRSHLPVPRGLISLRELKVLGIALIIIQVMIQVVFIKQMLITYAIVLGYLYLMTKEFFIPEWLRANHFWYAVSHMMIIPLVDIYASGLYWYHEGLNPPSGLIIFFVVSFFNGMVLEIGRKLKAPQDEAVGVNTYSALLGVKKAGWLWLALLAFTFFCTCFALYYANLGLMYYLVMTIVFILCCIPTILYLNSTSSRKAKMIELASGVWTLSMYLCLGGIPMLKSIFINH